MSFSTLCRDNRLIFLVLSMLTGLMGAFVHPLMSYFVVDELGSPPFAIGLYMFVVTVSGIFISQYMGHLVDRGRSAKKMYLIAVTGMSMALLIYANTDSLLVVLVFGLLFMSFGNAAVPQMLTLGHQWASDQRVNITSFNAQVRASISFAWIGGPPLAFALVGGFWLFRFFLFFCLSWAYCSQLCDVAGTQCHSREGTEKKREVREYAIFFLGCCLWRFS